MSDFIGREEERSVLENALRSPQSELIAVYGRRRIGKTFLIREVYAGKILLEWSGLHHGSLNDQLENFAEVLAKKMRRSPKRMKPNSWLQAFFTLQDYIDGLGLKEKAVIFIDEFPWLDTPRSKFLMGFGNFWNSYATRKNNLVVVICGSAAAYMIRKILRNRGGLHNRVTQRIALQPFNLHETELYLKSRRLNFSRYDILQLYMALGGIPFYLEKLLKGESVVQAIDRICFSKSGALTDEFQIVFSSLFGNSERHKSIVEALGTARKGLSRKSLSSQSGIRAGGFLTQIIGELLESGFVTQYIPFGKKNKDALYRLTDEYSLYYLKFIAPMRKSGAGTWKKLHRQRSYQAWSGFTFESICMKHFEQIREGLGIRGVFSFPSSWEGKYLDTGAQIDMLIERDDHVITLCEMKFSETRFSISKKYASEIRNKVYVFRHATKTRKSVFVTMITTVGLVQNKYSLECVENDLNLDCLFKF